MDRLMECVLNLSEGRRRKTLRQVAAKVSGVPRVWLLDWSADPDHNRSVYTFVGEPEAVSEAAFRVTSDVRGMIDLHRHRGVHPRIGAVDVIPFVPVLGVKLKDCAILARKLAERIGTELEIPVFLYGEAATMTDRRDLPGIRNLGFERLAEVIRTDPRWLPDFGPSRLHPTAGAVAVGARNDLIAFNVLLRTTDRETAAEIARRVRERDGGLPAVRALGLALPSRRLAQVSMNLVDFRKTGLQQAFSRVKEEARRLDVEVAASELIGLIPEEAWGGMTPEDIQLMDFDSSRILEKRIAEVIGSGSHGGRDGKRARDRSVPEGGLR